MDPGIPNPWSHNHAEHGCCHSVAAQLLVLIPISPSYRGRNTLHESFTHHIDMSSTSTTTMMMTPYFHFAGGDSLFFKTIIPSSNGAIAGAAIFLFCLAMLERFFASYRSHLEASWTEK